MYPQGPPTPIHFQDEISVELALLHKWGVITTLTFSKYSSLIFAVGRPLGKLRLLVDLTCINYLIRHGIRQYMIRQSLLTSVLT